jgi:RHS repeat-associated protein
MSFDAENRKTWSQDRRGYRTFFTYDADGRLRFTIQPDADDGVGTGAPTSDSDSRLANNPRSETQYDLVGRVRFQIDERGAKTEFTYEDGCGCAMRRKEMIQHRTAGNLVTHYEYDKAGNVRYVTDPRGNTVETRYDEHGRPRFVVYPATDEHPSTQTETKYDVLGRRVEMVDQEGKITRYRYDALGRLVEVRQYIDQSLAASDSNFQLASSNSGVASTRYSYDELGNQQTQTDALGRVTSYESDMLGRRTKRILPKDTTESTFLTESLQYDEWGNLWKRTDFAGKTTTFGYDALNRLKSKTADPTHASLTYGHAIAKIEFDYDANGVRTAARTFNASNTQLYAETTPRDERSRIDYKDTAGGRLDYSYYANNLLKDVVSSNSGGVNIGYRYDELNRLESVDDTSTGLPTRTSAYSYNANGSLETMTQPNGVMHAYGYDALNRLRGLVVTRGTTLLHSYEYKLRPSGHRREVVENSSRTTTYTYDDLYRLTSESIANDANANNGDIGYSLDKVGNRLNRSSQLSAVGSQLNQTFNARDWLNGDSYDSNGNTITGQLADLSLRGTDVYDFENRLIVRTKSDGTKIEIRYDADGYRIAKQIFNASAQSVSQTSWLVDTNNLTGYCQVFEERIDTPASGTTRRVYTYGISLISQATSLNAQPSTVNYYTTDGHGNVRELTDASGTITDRYDYDAFGNLTFQSGATPNAYRYCGEQFDPDLRLYFLRARYLNTDSGMFWSMDEYEGGAGDPASLHKYLYCAADPVGRTDPSGRWSLVEVMQNLAVQGYVRAMAYPRVFAIASFVLGMFIPAEVQIGLPNFGMGGGLAAIESSYAKELPSLRKAWQIAAGYKEKWLAGTEFEKWVAKALNLTKNTQAFKGGIPVPGGTGGSRIPDFFVSLTRQSIVEVKSASFDAQQAQEFARIAVNRGLGLTYIFLKNPGAENVKALRAAIAKVAPDLEVAINVVFP